MTIKFGTLEVPVDSDTLFVYASTLSIDPPLNAGELAKMKGINYIEAKQIKDEDVKLVDGQIVVVSQNVTQFRATGDGGQEGADRLYAAVEAIGKAAGRELDGDVILAFSESEDDWPTIVRFTVGTAGKVNAELARLYWPSTGTTSPIPS